MTGASPQARFESRGIAITGEGTDRVNCELTLHGETVPGTLEVTFNGSGRQPADRVLQPGLRRDRHPTALGLRPRAYAPAVGDEVVLEIQAEIQRAAPGA